MKLPHLSIRTPMARICCPSALLLTAFCPVIIGCGDMDHDMADMPEDHDMADMPEDHDMADMDHGGHAMAGPPLLFVASRPGDLTLPIAADSNPAADIVEIELRAAPTEVEYLPGKRTAAWAYNGTVPGPVIRAKLGDTMVVRFQNDLPEATSIHWHGLRVPAPMDGNPMVGGEIPPGGRFEYRFTLLDTGTFWYHPHVRSDEQVRKGLYGALIVEDPADPVLPTVAEHVVMLDDAHLDATTGAPIDPLADPPDGTMSAVAMMGREGNLPLVNGKPYGLYFPARAGDWYRLWLINVANARYFKLGMEMGRMVRVGGEHGLLPAPEEAPMILLAPGQRADVLVTAGMAMEAPILALPYDRGHASPSAAFTLFSLQGQGSAASARLPATLRPAVAPHASPSVERDFSLVEQMDGMNVRFQIADDDGSAIPPFTAALDTVERWTVFNDSKMDHPFHIHGFFFRREGFAERMDTINVPARSGVVLNVDFGSFSGAAGHWMYHCHILEHAERGMMGMFELR